MASRSASVTVLGPIAETNPILDVQMFTVWEKGAKDESGFIGYCYLDLFPRCMSLAPPPLYPN